MSDRFDRFTVPAPGPSLRARVLAAASHQRPPVVVRCLDILGTSRAWWLAWSAAMLLLILVAGPRPESPSDREAAEQWRNYRAQAETVLGGTGLPRTRQSADTSGGAV